VCIWVTPALMQCVPSAVSISSKVCQLPISGNVQWYVAEEQSAACVAWNNPVGNTHNETQAAACMISQDCITIVARFYCSYYCGGCPDGFLLGPCQDLCDNYTACIQQSPCLPPFPTSWCVQGHYSYEAHSEKFCSALAVNVSQFPDKGTPPETNAHGSHSRREAIEGISGVLHH